MRFETRTICAECGKEFDTYEPVRLCPECVNSPENELDYQKRMALAYQAEAKDLRAALAERDAKIRELDAWLTEKGEQQSDQFGNYGDSYCEGKADAYDAAGTKLRRLGLITEEQP